jgi:hypothetical protein
MSALLTPAEVGDRLRCRDRRTVRRRLWALGVPVVPTGRGYLVRAVDLDRAIAAAVRPLERSAAVRAGGVQLPEGVRLGTAEATAYLLRSVHAPAYGAASAPRSKEAPR